MQVSIASVAAHFFLHDPYTCMAYAVNVVVSIASVAAHFFLRILSIGGLVSVFSPRVSIASVAAHFFLLLIRHLEVEAQLKVSIASVAAHFFLP